MKRILLLFLILPCISSGALSQSFRGSVSGTVTDTNGGAISAAKITLTDIATRTSLVTETNWVGFYMIQHISSGWHRLQIEASGFRPIIIERLEIRVGDQVTLDRTLEIGPTMATVLVSGDSTPLLESSSASLGQVVDRRRIEDLPLPDGNPFTLARLTPGVVFTDINSLRFTRPFDNGGTSSISVNGTGSQRSEFTLDGIPNNAAFGRQVAYVPPSEAIQEFRVVTSSFDAQEGHSAGAQIYVVSRRGKNRLFGSIYWFNRNEALAANEFFVNANPNCEKDPSGKCNRAPLRYNRYGATLGGPVILPHFGEAVPAFWSGKHRLFFFFAHEGLRQVTPATNTFTVPTLAMRNGDFSALLPDIVIYDPNTAFLRSDGRVERRPFPGNIIPPERFSPIARNFLSYWVLPNLPCTDAHCRNNLVASVPRTDFFHSELVRVDAMVDEKNRFFVRSNHNHRKQHTQGFTGVINGVDPTTSESFRINDGLGVDYVHSASSTLLLNVRVGLTRFKSINSRAAEGVFDVSLLGFPQNTATLFRRTRYFPQFNITNFNPNTGGGTFGAPVSGKQTFQVYSLQPVLTKIIRDHSSRFGYDLRIYRVNEHPASHEAGLYEFNSAKVATRQFSDSPAASIGPELAALLLGIPSDGRIDRNTTRNNQLLYHSLFVQDNWKVGRRLTVNLGLRWEMESAPTDRFNRNVRGFDFTSPSPVEAAARAAYALNPIPQVPVDAFRVRGGLTFASEDNRGFYEPDKNNFQPRIGFAYELDSKTVLRAGFAVYSVPFYIDAVNQSGFSQSTLLVPTLNSGLTFRASLADPFPNGVIEPPGSSLGLGTLLGQAVSFVPVKRNNALARRYILSLQRELPGGLAVNVAFVRNLGSDMSVAGIDLNPVPRQYLTTLNQRDPVVDSFLLAHVPNPFRGLLPGTEFDGSTIERRQLLRPFPQFGSIFSERYDGSSEYNSAQLHAERRFAQGYTFTVSYTRSQLIEEVSLLNPTDTRLERRISGDDYPHRLVIDGIYELPVGKGRPFFSNAGRLFDLLFGGLQIQGLYQYQSGRPMALGNVAYFSDPNSLRTNIDSETVSTVSSPDRVVFDTSGFFAPGVDIRLRNNVRTFPSRLSVFRSMPISQVDFSVLKNIDFSETTKLQLRAEFLNATNTPQFGEPNLDPTSSNFGRVMTQVNLPRNVQVAVRFVF